MKLLKVELTEEEIVYLISTLNPDEDTEFDIKMRLMDSIKNNGIIIDLAVQEYSIRESKIYEIIQDESD